MPLIPKSGRIFLEFLNNEALTGPKPSAGRNGSISSTQKSIMMNGPKENCKFFTTLIKNTKLNGI
jgi:hypothetical protein